MTEKNKGEYRRKMMHYPNEKKDQRANKTQHIMVFQFFCILAREVP
jgi:hypothetical protein